MVDAEDARLYREDSGLRNCCSGRMSSGFCQIDKHPMTEETFSAELVCQEMLGLEMGRIDVAISTSGSVSSSLSFEYLSRKRSRLAGFGANTAVC